MKLYQVSSCSHDECDNYLWNNLTTPTTSYDKALEDYEKARESALNSAREDLYLEDSEDIKDHATISEADHTFHITYNRNGSIQVQQIAIHVWDVELEEKPSQFVLIGVDGNYRATARTFDEAKVKAKELAEYGYSEVVEVIDTVTQKCVFKYERD